MKIGVEVLGIHPRAARECRVRMGGKGTSMMIAILRLVSSTTVYSITSWQ